MKLYKEKQMYNKEYDKMKKCISDLKKLFKYQLSRWLIYNENGFNEIKEFFKFETKFNNNRIKKIIF